MNIVDLLSTIITATVVVVFTLGVVTYLAFRVRRARRPGADEASKDGSWYFVRYDPDGGATDGS